VYRLSTNATNAVSLFSDHAYHFNVEFTFKAASTTAIDYSAAVKAAKNSSSGICMCVSIREI
jgi:hypothetical protein